MPKRKQIGPCSVKGCGNPIETKYWCHDHYVRKWKFGRLEKVNTGLKRKHPLYSVWFERKQRGGLCAKWLDFWEFVKDVGEQPGPDFALVRLHDEPYGPDNFEWREHLRRRKGESKKAWHARKWASRRKAFPEFETDRYMRRKYGVTLECYRKMLDAQGGLCAICRKDETSIEYKTGETRNLAVDHCHDTGRVRGLLCFDCNSAIGKLKHSPALLDAAKQYLTHADAV